MNSDVVANQKNRSGTGVGPVHIKCFAAVGFSNQLQHDFSFLRDSEGRKGT